ncbi:polyketide cyclase [Paenibacillus sambharensis]|uniref:Polyketide cyclase n=1 Tax=Paenibacillus sambharensis TaxID=1803190 RepID=A0A2W1L9C2_9BACL|nr:SRPBCC family protein [Paenibacillus sambharensis]PZD95359.1 polyketide cyclase [Paenibacillus sambharensis]
MELKYEFYIGAKPDKVWEILTSKEGTRSIFFGCELRSAFREGEPFEYRGPGSDGDETVHVYGTILAYEPGKRLSMTEHPGPSYYSNHAELESRMTYTLEEMGECTKLTLINDQWTENHPGMENARASWWMILSNIKTLAETGRTLQLGE